MFQNKKLERKNTFYVQYLFPANRAIYEINVAKCGSAGQVTDDNMAHELCVLGKQTQNM